MKPEDSNALASSFSIPSEMEWLDPARQPSPADALARIRALCELYPDLYSAALAVIGTHQSVPRTILASAIKRFRRELDPLSREDVVSLLVALANGGRQGFDAVLRTRKTNDSKPASPMSWVKE